MKTLQGSLQYEQYHIVIDYYTIAFQSVYHSDISLSCCHTEGRNRSNVFHFNFIAVIVASGRVTGRQRIKCGAIQWQQPQSPKHFIATKSKYFSEPKTLLKCRYFAYISFCCLNISVNLCLNKEMKAVSHPTPCCTQTYPNLRLNRMFLTSEAQQFFFFLFRPY